MRNGTKPGLGFAHKGPKLICAGRKLYLVLATGCAALTALTLGVYLLLQVTAQVPTPRISPPPNYKPNPVTLDTGTVAQSLQPPQNVRFVLDSSILSKPLRYDQSLGYFDADTANGLARFPADFDITGGPDASRFERVSVIANINGNTELRAGLVPSAELLAQINNAISAGSKAVARSFTLNVRAHDSFGNTSAPTPVTFTLTYGQTQAQAPAPQPQEPAALSDLQKLARDIAQTADPGHTPLYFDVYAQAQAVPARCGVGEGDSNYAGFLRGYSESFSQLKDRLNASNVQPFLHGVCAGWEKGAEKEIAARQEFEKAVARDQARKIALAQKISQIRAWAEENGEKASSILEPLFKAFLVLSLILALFVIESHLAAIRKASVPEKDETDSENNAPDSAA